MDEIEQLLKEAYSNINQGNRQIIHHWRHSRSKGMQKIANGNAKLKQAMAIAGRLRKKMKHIKKTTQIITLTECFGIPWRIRIPK